MLLVLALSGCSAIVSDGTETEAVTLGQQAIGFTSSSSAGSTGSSDSAGSSSSSSSTIDWSSSATCPPTLRRGMVASIPAGATLTDLTAAATTGILVDPGVTLGDVPSCAFALSISGRTTQTDGTQQVFTKGTAEVAIEDLSVNGISFFAVVG